MNHKPLLIAGLVATGTIIAIVFGPQIVSTSQTPASAGCLPADVVSTAAPFFKAPTYLPPGYDYKCGVANLNEARVLYWDQPTNGETLRDGPEDFVLKHPGAILLSMTGQPQITNSTAEVIFEYNNILEINPALKPQLIDINGKLAWANEAVLGGGKQTAVLPEGTVLTNSFDVPARLRMYHEGISIHLEGFVSLDELVKMAKSLPLP